MALIHTDADIHPGKLDLIGAWLPRQSWGSDAEPVREAGFRLDDPAGEVGMETFLLRVGDDLLHVPLTYRGSPLEGGALVGEMEHTALGHRWVYDAATDPVYLKAAIEVIAGGGQEAELVAADGSRLPRPATAASARGSGAVAGSATMAATVVRRPLSAPVDTTGAAGTLSATWAGQSEPVVLVVLRSDRDRSGEAPQQSGIDPNSEAK